MSGAGQSSRTSVVVTGLGATTPLGGDVASTWSALLAGRSGVRTLPYPWVEEHQLPVHIAATIAVEPAEVLTKPETKRWDRSAQFALVAAREAWQDAGSPEVDGDRIGVAVASGIGGVTTLLDAYDRLKARGPRGVLPLTVPMLMGNSPAAAIGLEVEARAGVHTPVSACASGAEAIGYGLEMIRSGRADVVIAGGTEACIHVLPLAAFNSMQALSTRNDEPERASRPYDKGRDGFVMGEGAGVLVLESEEHARARGARVYAEVLGAGMTSDAHHIAAPEPDGKGAARAMLAAVQSAGIGPRDIGHINAHATSTPVGDIAEALAIRAAFGDAGREIPVTSTKSMTGHLLGAAGAVESIACILAMRDGVIPPTTNMDDPDDHIGLDVVAEPRPLGEGVALNNSFGFGGHNVALVLKGERAAP